MLWFFERVSKAWPAARTVASDWVRADIQLLLDASDDPNLSAQDKAMIRRVFAFTEAVVEDAMVPLIHVIAVSEAATCAEAVEQMIKSGHSRLPDLP